MWFIYKALMWLSKVLKGFIRLLIACVKFVGGYSIGFMYYIVTRVLQ